MKIYYLGLAFMLLIAFKGNAQDHQKIYQEYVASMKLYEQKELGKAIQGLENVIQQDPRHKDAIFNLALMHIEAGHKEKGIGLLQTAVRLSDRTAADLLKKQLNQKIAYYDTMSTEDVDSQPYIEVNSRQEAIVTDKGLNKKIDDHLIKGFKYSRTLQKAAGKKYSAVLSFYVSKDGKLDAEILKCNAPKEVQEEILKVVNSVNQLTPAKHEGKEVVVSLKAVLPLYL